jgi:hypothetical protein
MTATRDPQSVIAAAEQAAAAGDYESAEQLLREAAGLQEASGGPLDPDLANTLNNLAIVCEMTEKPADAEQFFRRAHAIAKAALEPDHPFVATSRKNLEDFCAARGVAVDVAEPPPAAPVASEESRPLPLTEPSRPVPPPVKPSPPLPPSPPPVRSSRPDPPAVAPPTTAPARSSRAVAVGALIAAGLLLLVVTLTWFRSNRGDQPPAAQSATPVVQPNPPAATPAAKNDPSGPATRAPASAPTPGTRASKPPSAPPAKPERRNVLASTAPPTVIAAQVCKDLSTAGAWRCVPAGAPASAGALFFYTRIKSSTPITVQHRWYRDDRLRRTVDLKISANATEGYRTFSRNTVDGRGSGEWKVELRTADGVLLHEERFVVR